MLSVRVLLIAFGFLAAGQSAHAATSRALVIGINAYEQVPALSRAAEDAVAMQQALVRLGFQVDIAIDTNRRDLNKAFSDFQKKLAPGDTALVHFSGHGVEIDGENYLLPADIPQPTNGDRDYLRGEALSLSDVMQRISSTGAAVRIFIIDACRDNPFAKGGTRSIGAQRGLSRVDAPAGTFILYSAGYHETALDSLGEGDQVPMSVYTRALVAKLGEPGKSIADIAQEVRVEVEATAKLVGHQQRPAYYDELSGQFFFIEPGEAPPPPPVAEKSPVVVAAVPEAEAFKAAQSIDTPDAYQAYLNRFPDGFYADLAKAALAKLDAGVIAEPDVRGNVDADGMLRAFVEYTYLAGNLLDRDHLLSIYGDRVVYYDRGAVQPSEVVADKRAYGKKWPSVAYNLIPGTLSVGPLAGGRYLATFQYDFAVANGSRSLAGTAETRLVIDLASGTPRIVEENGSVITRR